MNHVLLSSDETFAKSITMCFYQRHPLQSLVGKTKQSNHDDMRVDSFTDSALINAI